MKKISVLIPCYNEVDNVEPMANALSKIFTEELPKYDYEIVFIDNASTDGTRDLLEVLCHKNEKVKAIFNVTNFGQFNSPFHGMCECHGDAVINIACDFQEPPELIVELVKKWEEGHKIVCAVKTKSKENPIVYALRSIYYRLIKNMSSVRIIEQFSGFALYDKSFIKLMRKLDDPLPFMRGIVAEYGEGFNMTTVEFEQQKRTAGKTKNNFYSLYDAAMLSFTSYTKVGLRLATFLGFFIAGFSFIVGMVYLVYKLVKWNQFNAGLAPLTVGIFFLGGIVMIFLGLLGEYILNINTRVIHRPIVVEERRIGWEDEFTEEQKTERLLAKIEKETAKKPIFEEI